MQHCDKPIFKVAISIPVYRLFDYLAPEDAALYSIKPGVRVEVPFGKGKKIGYLLEIATHSEFDLVKLKPIIRVIDPYPLLSNKDLRLLQWAASYYHHPIGVVIGTAFPAALRQGKVMLIKPQKRYALTELGIATNSQQLQRSPNQLRALEKFQSSGLSLTEAELTAWEESWRPAVRQLISKQLIQLNLAEASVTKAGALLSKPALPANTQQQVAIDAVCASLGQFGVFLLDGVTGSGKTEVYLQIIRSVLERGQQVLVLVPEITLTPQLEERFRQRFAVDIALSHSKLTDKQRGVAWLKMQQGQGSILLGTRSALFTPLKNPGLIILDEEHDGSFKQQEGFRFSARDIAVVRGQLLHVPVLLGSATPSLESLHNVNKERYQLLALPARAGKAIEPTLHLLDIRNKRMQEGLSAALLEEMHKTLAKQEQVLLFLNRRGFAPTLICHGCGWVARCHRCDANLVIHVDENCLRCHHCAKEQPLLRRCP